MPPALHDPSPACFGHRPPELSTLLSPCSAARACYHPGVHLRSTVACSRAVAGTLLAVATGCSTAGASPRVASSRASSSPTSIAAPASLPEERAVQPERQDEPESLTTVEQATGQGWLGAELAEPDPDQPGAFVKAVVPRSPAARADLRSDDIIVSADGVTVSSVEAFIRWVRERPAGARIHLGVVRQHAQRLIAVELSGVPSDDDLARMRFVGFPAPRFEQLSAVQGSLPASLSAFRGRVVVVEFWASWCASCQALVSVLNGWKSRYGDQGLSLLGIALEPADDTRLAVRHLGIDFPIAADESLTTAKSYHGGAVPTLFVIDQNGTVRDVMIGYSTSRLVQLEALIARLLGRR
jgi:thiol-disulfide isomerase/thioredoxin